MRIAVPIALIALGGLASCGGSEPSASTVAPTVSAASDSTSLLATTTTSVPLPEVGVGDPYFPTLGNVGYDVDHYLVDLAVDVGGNTINGHVAMSATATQDLEVLTLDFVGLEVDTVDLDGDDVPFGSDEEKLVVGPFDPIPAGESFVVTVAYGGTPEPIASPTGFLLGWRSYEGVSDDPTDDLVFVVSEPDGARSWMPCNDHPSDKASFTYRLTVDEELDAAANGVLVDVEVGGESRTFVWEMEEPMATYLATIVVGDVARVERPGPGGIVIRDYLPDEQAEVPASFMQTGDVIEFFADTFGPYPFDTYGHALVNPIEGALETQTLTLISPQNAYAEQPDDGSMPFLPDVVPHEVAHQWFGNSVTPSTWQDIWLSEGFATYATWLWDGHRWGPDAYQQNIDFALTTLLDGPVVADPGVGDLFGPHVYFRGALALAALRAEVGDDTFFEIIRTWTDRYAFANASTADLVALSEEVSGSDLTDLFRVWLVEPEIPEGGIP